MHSSHRKRVVAWLHWLLFSESLILLLALAGPGYRYAIRKRGDHALIARLFIEDPTYLEAVAVNLVVLHLFIGSVLFAAWLIPRLQKKG